MRDDESRDCAVPIVEWITSANERRSVELISNEYSSAESTLSESSGRRVTSATFVTIIVRVLEQRKDVVISKEKHFFSRIGRGKGSRRHIMRGTLCVCVRDLWTRSTYFTCYVEKEDARRHFTSLETIYVSILAFSPRRTLALFLLRSMHFLRERTSAILPL